MKTHKAMARIFADVGGYYVCDDSLPYLDTRGRSYKTKAEAMRAALESGYTHGTGSGVYRQGKSLRSQVRGN